MSSEPNIEQRLGNPRVIRGALLACGLAFVFAFSLVPLYRIFCEFTGLNYTNFFSDGRSSATAAAPAERWVTVQFDGSVQSNLPWAFRPQTVQMRVLVGEFYETYYVAENTSGRDLVGQANPSVAPNQAALYFHKTECFCFTEQLLKAGESRDMPVRFFVDPDLPSHVHQLTLSYTFHLNPQATAQIASAPEPAGTDS